MADDDDRAVPYSTKASADAASITNAVVLAFFVNRDDAGAIDANLRRRYDGRDVGPTL